MVTGLIVSIQTILAIKHNIIIDARGQAVMINERPTEEELRNRILHQLGWPWAGGFL